MTLLALLMVSLAIPGGAASPAGEVRAVWLNPWAFNSPETRAATLARIRRANLNTAFLQTPAVAGNFGIKWGGVSATNYAAFINDLKEAGVAAHAWIINYERAGEGTQADFTSPREGKAQTDWTLAILKKYRRLDGVHFDYIRYREWSTFDMAKAGGLSRTVWTAHQAIRQKYPGKFLTAAVYVTASANYMGETRDGKEAWTDPLPKWFLQWRSYNPVNWYSERHKSDQKLKPEWLLGPSFFKYQQDPVTWLSTRSIDAVCPMQYTADKAVWKDEVDLWKSFRGETLDGIVMGLGWLKDGEHPEKELKPEPIVKFIEYGRSQGLKGFSVFSLCVPGIDDEPLIKALAEPCPANNGKPPFAEPALSWLLSPGTNRPR